MARATLILSAIVIASSSLAAEGPPVETLSRLKEAARAMEGWRGTFVLTTRATVSKPNGDNREDTVTVMRMVPGENGPEVAEIVTATRNGEDVTAQTRRSFADERAKRRERASRKNDGEGDDGGVSLTLPGDEETEKFAFSPAETGDDTCGARFAPRPERARDADLTIGELRWDCATLDPLWVIARPAKNPKRVAEMRVRMELQRAGDALFVARTVTDGVGGILFIKRRFHVETEVSDLMPAGAASEL